MTTIPWSEQAREAIRAKPQHELARLLIDILDALDRQGMSVTVTYAEARRDAQSARERPQTFHERAQAFHEGE